MASTKNTNLLPSDDAGLLFDIKERIRSAQYEALKAVNREQIALDLPPKFDHVLPDAVRQSLVGQPAVKDAPSIQSSTPRPPIWSRTFGRTSRGLAYDR